MSVYPEVIGSRDEHPWRLALVSDGTGASIRVALHGEGGAPIIQMDNGNLLGVSFVVSLNATAKSLAQICADYSATTSGAPAGWPSRATGARVEVISGNVWWLLSGSRNGANASNGFDDVLLQPNSDCPQVLTAGSLIEVGRRIGVSA